MNPLISITTSLLALNSPASSVIGIVFVVMS